MEQLFDAAVQGRPDDFAFGDPAPFTGRGDRARIGRESDQTAVFAISLAHQLAQGQLAVGSDSVARASPT